MKKKLVKKRICRKSEVNIEKIKIKIITRGKIFSIAKFFLRIAFNNATTTIIERNKSSEIIKCKELAHIIPLKKKKKLKVNKEFSRV